MRKYLNGYFLIGAIIGVFPVAIYSSYVSNKSVLSASFIDKQAIESSSVPSLTYEETEKPTPLPTLIPTQSPTKEPIPTPSPTILPQPTIVPTPISTIVPAPTLPIVAPQDLEPLFIEFSSQYGVDVNLLKQIADCESHFNPAVVNGPYAGMFQFTEGLWVKYRTLMNKDPNPDLRFGARESIETAAYIIANKGSGAWPVCSK